MQLEDRVRTIMSRVLGVDPAAIGPQTTREELEKWDSLGHMNLCVAFEEEFEISLSVDQVTEMGSFPDVVRILSETSR